MLQPQFRWDIFIAHASADRIPAEELYHCLERESRVFLDTKTLRLGDQWDRELEKAQRESLITVVLVSEHTEDAFYAREEIAAATQLARESAGGHRVVPIYLTSQGIEPPHVPSGLRLRRGSYIRVGW